MFKSGLNKALITWHAFAENASDARRRLKSGLRKLANSDLTYAFMQISAASSRRALWIVLRRNALEHAAPRKVLRRMVDRWSGRGALRRGGLKIAQHMMSGLLRKGACLDTNLLVLATSFLPEPSFVGTRRLAFMA